MFFFSQLYRFHKPRALMYFYMKYFYGSKRHMFFSSSRKNRYGAPQRRYFVTSNQTDSGSQDPVLYGRGKRNLFEIVANMLRDWSLPLHGVVDPQWISYVRKYSTRDHNCDQSISTPRPPSAIFTLPSFYYGFRPFLTGVFFRIFLLLKFTDLSKIIN